MLKENVQEHNKTWTNVPTVYFSQVEKHRISVNKSDWITLLPSREYTCPFKPRDSHDQGLPPWISANLLIHFWPQCTQNISSSHVHWEQISGIQSTLWVVRSLATYAPSLPWHYSSQGIMCCFLLLRPLLTWPLYLYWQSTQLRPYYLSTLNSSFRNINIDTCTITWAE